MRRLKHFLQEVFSAPFQFVLVVSFSLVAAMTIGIGAWVTSRIINNYLAGAMSERITRDMHLAETFYDIKLRDISGIARRLALDPIVIDNMTVVSRDEAASRLAIDRQIANKVSVLALGGSHFVAVLDANGDVVAGRLVSAAGDQSLVLSGGNWAGLPIVQQSLASRQSLASTEVVPSVMLAQIGLADQARIKVVDTPKAAPTLFDSREGSDGLGLVGVSPILDADGRVVGSAVALHLFNDDFALVDQIRDVAGIDTATIFHGDLRVSTNVLTPDGKRALGTRMSGEVRTAVLEQGSTFTGPAFVVDQNYVTRYEPLRDHANQVVGSLYVGVRQASFFQLVDTFNEQVLLVALSMILSTFLLAIPVSRYITRPLKELKELVDASRQVAQGDMTVRVPVRARGEVGLVATSFNSMLDTLQTTQEQLVHSEKMASLGQLAAGVAHELNNPLGTVLLYSDILFKECQPNDPRRADLEMIVRETKRCKGIVAGLLDFARQNQVAAQETDLNALIQSVIEIERKREVYARIQVVTELDPALPKIQADPAQLQEVFVNLMSNAVEAMTPGGTLTLRTHTGPLGMVTAEVEDNGEGISPENLGKLFTPFFTTKPVGRGTGLGLAIIYGIIKMHRGQINVQSQLRRGTCFTISLPIRLPGVALSANNAIATGVGARTAP